MLLIAALLFAENLEQGASAGKWLGSTVFLLLSIAIVSVLHRDIVLRFDLPASARRPAVVGVPAAPLGPIREWRAGRIGRVTNRIQAAMESLLASRARERVWVFHFGANDIHPTNLVFVICVQSDAEKARIEADADLRQRLRSLLQEYDYPEERWAAVGFAIESQQTVDRESGGNWRHLGGFVSTSILEDVSWLKPQTDGCTRSAQSWVRVEASIPWFDNRPKYDPNGSSRSRSPLPSTPCSHRAFSAA